MHLLSLPSEPLSRILEEVSPLDIINISVSCKNIHALAEISALPLHRTLRDKLHTLELDVRAGSSLSPMLYLCIVQRKPRLAYYPTKLHIRVEGTGRRTYLAPGDKMNTAVQDERTDIAQACGGFVDLLEESAYIEDELKLLWKERLLMGDEDAALALILSLLLNLRSLSTARDDCELPLTQHMIERIAKLDFTNEEAKPLGLLSRVSIKSNKNRDHPHDYHLLAALSRLPSLRTFAGTMRMSCLQCTNLMVSPVAEHIINEYRNPLFDPLSSNIDEIDLRNCNIGVPSIPGHSFVEFANCFRQLRKVRVVGCKFLESGSFKYLLTVLQPRGMHHLEELTFDLDGRTGEHTFDLLPTFRVLKTICVVFRPFAPLRELAVLINVLPQSLEVFGVDFQLREGAGVLSDSEEEQLRKKMYRLKLLADRKHDHTPNLHTFMVPDHVHETAMPKTAIKALSRAGIAVVCTGESSV